MARKLIPEIFFIRSIACLCVVLVHSFTKVVQIHGPSLSNEHELLLMTVRLIFTFGTPIFIFLSEFLLAYSYSNNVPDNFLSKRVKYILLPYISMGFIYAILMIHEANGHFIKEGFLAGLGIYFIRNLLFGFYYHGFFIIVIFQFYFFHIYLHKYLNKWSPKYVLSISLIINLLYLGFFNLTVPPNIPYGKYLWRGLLWGSFPSWIFYFTLGFYSGKHYNFFVDKINQHKNIIYFLPIIAGALAIYLYVNGIIIENSSRRVDILLLATSMIFVLYHIATKFKKIPAFFKFISNFSFSIYLLHMLYLYIIAQIFKEFTVLNYHPFITLITLFLGSTVAAIISSAIINIFKVGPYIVGRAPKLKVPLLIQKEFSSLINVTKHK